MEDGRTGFVVNDLEEAAQALQRLDAIDRRQCRQVFEERFSARRMAQDYVEIYQNYLSLRENFSLIHPVS
jgi:glycosyltransferase involved in cell wall biosynthesis